MDDKGLKTPPKTHHATRIVGEDEASNLEAPPTEDTGLVTKQFLTELPKTQWNDIDDQNSSIGNCEVFSDT